LPGTNKDFVIYSDASKVGIGHLMMQEDQVIAYSPSQLIPFKKNYSTHYL